MNIEMELLLDYFNKNANFKIDWNLIVQQVHGWCDQEIVEKDDNL